jgi:hypothetical protein
MNPVHIVGGIALAVGGGLLLSELFLGQDVLTEITGTQWVLLRFLCGTLVGGGLVTIGIGIWETKTRLQEERGGQR